MCGLFGIIDFENKRKTHLESDIKLGMELIKHRGPDGEGLWTSECGKAGLGHVRLSIIDLKTGNQPMVCSHDRYVIAYNGEIYNFKQIKQELVGFDFKTESDTEVILNSFKRWGFDCINKFNGMFAFAIWDKSEKKLFLARDRFGIKPLYYFMENKVLYFASEIKALLPFQNKIEINQKGLSQYFNLQHNLGETTMFSGINNFPVASFAQFSSDCVIDITEYWKPQFSPDFDHTEKWFISRAEELLNESIISHTVSDVEIGSYVSGGIDSSLVASKLAKLNKDVPIKFFNGRFKESLDYDESIYAKDVARSLNANYIQTEICSNDFLNNIDKVIYHLDQPTAGPGSFPQFCVSQTVSKHVKVVLGGQGGDEIFGGYTRYLIAYFERCILGAIDGTMNKGNYLVTYESIIPNLENLKNYIPLIKSHWSNGLFSDPSQRYIDLVNRSKKMAPIIDDSLLERSDVKNEYLELFNSPQVKDGSYFDMMTHFDFKTLLPALLTVEDRMSMAHGIESRVPLLDNDLYEFMSTIPADVKFKGGKLKRILAEIAKKYLPKSILDRKDKMGFPVPLNDWSKSNKKIQEFIRDTLGSQKAITRPYFKNKLDSDNFITLDGQYSRNLWALLSLELWQKRFIDK